MLYRILANSEVLSDFLVGETCHHSGNNLQFPWREAKFLLLGVFSRGLDQGPQILDQIRDALAADPVFSRHHSMNRLQKQLGRGILEYDAACA